MQDHITTRRASRGFTLIEILIALSMAGVLSSVAVPTFQGQLQKARRTDALVTMMQVQLAQSRWRANGSGYVTLAQIGVANVSSAGHYAIALTTDNDNEYEVRAAATGAQAGDTACRNMVLRVTGANVVHASGADASAANPAAQNRKCWNQ
ncbi:MAG: type IV pilin protein [Burkholderiales bacterium]